MSPGENPSCDPLHHWYRSISLHGGGAGKIMMLNNSKKLTTTNKLKNKQLYIAP